MSDRVIVIGAGVSGLAAAAYLARHGLQVAVYEANDKVGGSCANTTINGYTFNDGAMYLVMPALLDAVFDQLDVQRKNYLPLRRIEASSETILPDGSAIIIDNGTQITVNGVQDNASINAEIEAFLQRWQPVFTLFQEDLLQNRFSIWHFLRRAWRYLPQLRGTVADELSRQFDDTRLQAALSGALLYLGLPPEKMPIFSILGLVAMLSEGFYLPEKGMGAIPDALAGIVRRHGGEIHLGCPVRQIRLRSGHVCGVVANGELVLADTVIATTSGMITFGKFLADAKLPSALHKKVNQAQLSHKAISLQLGLKNQVTAASHSINHIPWMPQQHEIFTDPGLSKPWLAYSVPTVTIPELAPPGGSIIETYLPLTGDISPTPQTVEHRIARTLDYLTEQHPLDITVQRVRTPETFATEMHLFKGALYGLSPAAGFDSYFPYETPVHGLYQSGQTTYPGMGVVTSAMSGILAAECVLSTVERRVYGGNP